MDLERSFLDMPFSSYVYDGGYLGAGAFTELIGVFIDVRGTVDHIVDLTMANKAHLYYYRTGSTNNR